MKYATAGLLAIVMAALSVHAEVNVGVRVSGTSPSATSLQHEARLADWNSPLGRMSLFMAEQHANLLRGNQPGAAGAVAFMIKAQPGQPLQLIAASLENGVQISAAEVTRIPWPAEEAQPTEPLPFDEQLALLLGRRLQPK